MSLLRRFVGRIVQNVEVKRRTTIGEYEELRREYLSMGIILEDLYCYFEDRRCMDPEKEIIKELIKKHGFHKVYQDLWDWRDLAEEYNLDELRFLYMD